MPHVSAARVDVDVPARALLRHAIHAVVPFVLFAVGCEKDAKEEAREAVKELKQGDAKQPAEETNEALEKGVKDTADKIRDATN